MTNRHGTDVLTEAPWRRLSPLLSPLIEAVGPRGKTEHHDLRRTIAAIIWRHRNGATWRSIPAELGPWWMDGRPDLPPPGPPRGVGAPAGGGAGARRRLGHDVP